MAHEALHRRILQDMREGVMTLDLQGTITTFNSAAEQILGLERSRVEGKVLAEVFLEREGTDEFVEGVLAAVVESNTTHQQRVRFPTKSGERLLALTTSFLHGDDAAGNATRLGVVAVFSDVTEIEQLREDANTLETFRVEQLVRAYRERGHSIAEIDPLGLREVGGHPELTPEHHGLDRNDPHALLPFVHLGQPVKWSLARILEHLQGIYCGPVGVQYMHIDDPEIQGWLRSRLEDGNHDAPLPRDTQLHILRKLTDAETFETFVQRTFKRSKRFSLEGAETLIPLLDQAVEQAAEHGVEEITIGMSHRGRLNVLVNLLEVPASEIFRRFEQLESGEEDDRGDVRFHVGADAVRKTQEGRDVRLSLCFNPSHLEFVGPVVLGRARARQDRAHQGSVLPLVVHGDGAFAGQGIVQELFNMSGLPAYSTGGAVHVVLNNQIGFTTTPEQGRSTQYATDVARMLQIPIFHVNGERPEAVNRVVRLALDFWQRWRRDVVVDMYCYRRHGHMEQDDPRFTQPALYRAIEARPPIRESYTRNVVALGEVTDDEATEIARASRDALDRELARAGKEPSARAGVAPGAAPRAETQTAVAVERLHALLTNLSTLPSSFEPHAKVSAVLRRRKALTEGRGSVDWATAEALAFASLLSEGRSVRLTGQDSERGTFAHRHAVLHDAGGNDTHTPLNACTTGDARLTIANSPLSEAAVLAFEFGYGVDAPDDLVVWEAQFGDFANVAQVVIDQFIMSSEEKWGQSSRLTLLLPHGLEGQGPEHSSARVERFLQLCAHHNVELVQPTTAAQIFHRLRRQALSRERRPLVVFTPKRLLQHASASTPLEALSVGAFEPLLLHPASPEERILLCSGQVGPALLAEREKLGAPCTVVRLEQLYPFPTAELAAFFSQRSPSASLVWVQEEPENMGAWHWLRPQLDAIAGDRKVTCVSRPEGASPATGSYALHQRQQATLLAAALR